MNVNPAKSHEDTVRLRRPPPRVFTKMHGQTVWMGEVQALELELEPESVSDDPYNTVNIKRPE